MSREIPREIVLRSPTPLLADAMDRLGIADFALDRFVRPLMPGMRMAGPALCVTGRVRPHPLPPPAGLYTEIDRAVTPGCIVVVATGAYDEAAVIGGNAAIGFQRRGAAGILVDGTARDSDEFAELDFPCFCRGTSVLGFPGRWDYTAIDVPVELRGIGSRPVHAASQDIVVADLDGALVVPFGRLAEVAETVTRLDRRQARIKRLLLDGVDRAAAYQ